MWNVAEILLGIALTVAAEVKLIPLVARAKEQWEQNSTSKEFEDFVAAISGAVLAPILITALIIMMVTSPR